jgi:hypothetical protein
MNGKPFLPGTRALALASAAFGTRDANVAATLADAQASTQALTP